MTHRAYKRATSVCFWTLIAAALLFERVGDYSWLLGWLAVAAVLVAITLHFYTLWQPAKEENEETTSTVTTFPREPAIPELLVRLPRRKMPFSRSLSSELEHAYLDRVRAASSIAYQRSARISRTFIFDAPIFEPKPPIDVDAIVKLVQKLTVRSSQAYEFSLNLQSGDLIIRTIKAESQSKESAIEFEKETELEALDKPPQIKAAEQAFRELEPSGSKAH